MALKSSSPNLKSHPARDVDRRRDPECDSPLLERVAGVEQESRGEGRQDPSEVGHRVGEAHDDARVQRGEVQHAERDVVLGNV